MASDKLAILREYLDRLAENDFEQAAAQFTEDVYYRHPPIDGAYEVNGRADLYEYFADTRGPRDITHEILRSVEAEDACAMVVEFGSEADREIAVSYAGFADGKIDYYVAGTLGLSDPFGEE